MREDDRARWTKLVADFESADLSQREFAQERGLPLSNLRYWIYRLRKESRPLVTEAAERSDQGPDRAAALERTGGLGAHAEVTGLGRSVLLQLGLPLPG
jgi:transposase